MRTRRRPWRRNRQTWRERDRFVVRYGARVCFLFPQRRRRRRAAGAKDPRRKGGARRVARETRWRALPRAVARRLSAFALRIRGEFEPLLAAGWVWHHRRSPPHTVWFKPKIGGLNPRAIYFITFVRL
jgi:hypothetical protein